MSYAVVAHARERVDTRDAPDLRSASASASSTELIAPAATSHVTPYRRGSSRVAVSEDEKVTAATTSATVTAAVTIAVLTGTAVRPRPGSSAKRTPMTAGAERPRAASRDARPGRPLGGPTGRGTPRRTARNDGSVLATVASTTASSPPATQDERVDGHAGVELGPPRDRSRQRHQGRERDCAERRRAAAPATATGSGAEEGGDAHPARRQPEGAQRRVVPRLEHDLAAERLADEEQAGDGDRGREGLEARASAGSALRSTPLKVPSSSRNRAWSMA